MSQSGELSPIPHIYHPIPSFISSEKLNIPEGMRPRGHVEVIKNTAELVTIYDRLDYQRLDTPHRYATLPKTEAGYLFMAKRPDRFVHALKNEQGDYIYLANFKLAKSGIDIHLLSDGWVDPDYRRHGIGLVGAILSTDFGLNHVKIRQNPRDGDDYHPTNLDIKSTLTNGFETASFKLLMSIPGLQLTHINQTGIKTERGERDLDVANFTMYRDDFNDLKARGAYTGVFDLIGNAQPVFPPEMH